MTQTSKAPTFRIIKGTRDRLNIETGVVIRKSEPDNGDGTYYYVLAPTRDGFDIITTERTLAAAREQAIERVELMRGVIAEAYDAANAVSDDVLADKTVVEVRIIDVIASARALGMEGYLSEIAGRPTPAHDYRFSVAIPAGGEVTFSRQATAAYVAAYCEREGWLPARERFGEVTLIPSHI